MSPENRSPNAGSSPPARTLIVEWLVVGSVLVSLAATFVAVAAFLASGAKRPKPPDSAEKPTIASAAAPDPAPAPPVAKPAPAEAAPPRPEPPPDTSIDRARELERRIAEARKNKAKTDLMTWSARKAADWLKARAQQTETATGEALSAGEKAAADAARLRGHASDLADAVARLELKRDDAKTRLETARTRKGYSILPYRGPSGAWQRPLPIECSRDSAQIMPGGPTFRLIDLELSGLSPNSLFARIVELAMRKAAAQATPDGNAPTVYVLFVVRPSGIKAYYEARARLQAQGVAFGYELVGENTPIDYPDLGDLSEWPGYVLPDEIAEAIAAEPVGSSPEPSLTNSVNAGGPGGPGIGGSSTEPGKEGDGLFVWREGLDGKRTVPGNGPNGPGAPGGQSGDRPGIPAGTGVPGAGTGQVGEPRVDFGSATPGQRGRPGGIGRGPGFPGLAESGQPGGVSTSPGTFEDLVAELAARGNMEAPKSMTRPGAVAILPGDLADDLDSSSESPLRGGGLMPRNRAGRSGVSGTGRQGGISSPPGLPAAPSPFGTTPPTLPRFEPAPGTNAGTQGANAIGSAADATGNAGTPGLAANAPEANSGPIFSDESAEANAPGGRPGTAGTRPGSAGAGRSEHSESTSNSDANASRGSNGAAAGSPAGPSNPAASERGSKGRESASGAGSSGGGSPAGQPAGEGPRFGLRNSVRRLFGGEERLPEKSWEVGLTCDADGLTIRPGEHRLSLKDLQNDPDLLPRTLQSMFERHVRENPERFWRPYVKYRLAAGGEPMMGLSQQQLAAGFVRWPAIVEPVASSGREGPR